MKCHKTFQGIELVIGMQGRILQIPLSDLDLMNEDFENMEYNNANGSKIAV